MNRLRPLLPFALLAVLGLTAFWPLVLHPSHVLYSEASDLIVEHLPAKMFFVRSLRETGELPLWCPEQYGGSPFVHDIQVGLFYPPNAPLYFLNEGSVGPFLSCLAAGHIVLAGWLMYGYGRHAGLTPLAAFVAGLGYMLAPRWMMQLLLAGHTITIGLAWIPLVLIGIEKTLQGGSWRWAGLAGLAYALMILGTHPQYTFYASLLIGLWPLRIVENRRLIVRWLVAEGIVVALGVGLAAVQLLPTWEAAGETTRARGVEASGSALEQASVALNNLIGPFVESKLDSVLWETSGGIGLLWGALALVAPRLAGRPARFPAAIAIAMLLYALGLSAIADRLPGFNLFRIPTRMLITLAFPVAYLVALSVQTLDVQKWSADTRPRLTGPVAFIAGLAAVTAGLKLLFKPEMSWVTINPWWVVYWIALPILVAAALTGSRYLMPRTATLFLVAVLVADILLVVVPYPSSRPANELYMASPIADYLRAHAADAARLYDPDGGDNFGRCFLGQGSPNASALGIPSVRGYRSLDVARYRQFLAFVAGRPEQLPAFSNEFAFPAIPAFHIENRDLFDLLGAKYVVTQPGESLVAGWQQLAFDESPRSYNLFGGGMQTLSPQRLFKNPTAMPRAFVVRSAVKEEADESGVYRQLTRMDVRNSAIVADWDMTADPMPIADRESGSVAIREYHPNRVTLDLDGRTAGLLVLTDPWYPGWICTVDGVQTKVWRADYAFRGVMVHEGAKEVVFAFEPKSYRIGRTVTFATIGVLVLTMLTSPARWLVRKKRAR